MAKKIREMENHHNQAMTSGAAQRQEAKGQRAANLKVVVLRLEPQEYEAFQQLGGADAFKAWLREN